MRHVAVIDYGMGNLRSVSKALETVSDGVPIEVTADPSRIKAASHIVFPGVGAIRDCMSELTRLELDAVIKDIADTKPLLGICLGMQALLNHSEENGGVDTLGLVSGQVKHFDTGLDRSTSDFKVPHMGWNEVSQSQIHPLWSGITQDSRFYFVHSFYVSPEQAEVTAATTHYQLPFSAALAKDNIFATQFHPEKSQTAGLQLLKNFLDWDGQS